MGTQKLVLMLVGDFNCQVFGAAYFSYDTHIDTNLEIECIAKIICMSEMATTYKLG